VAAFLISEYWLKSLGVDIKIVQKVFFYLKSLKYFLPTNAQFESLAGENLCTLSLKQK
jgi:hypothetical protein